VVTDAAGTDGGPFESGVNIDTNDHLLLWRHTGSTITLDEDGVNLISTANTPGTTSPNQAAIAARPSSTHTQFYDGKVGSIRVDASDLSSDVRAAIAAAFPA